MDSRLMDKYSEDAGSDRLRLYTGSGAGQLTVAEVKEFLCRRYDMRAVPAPAADWEASAAPDERRLYAVLGALDAKPVRVHEFDLACVVWRPLPRGTIALVSVPPGDAAASPAPLCVWLERRAGGSRTVRIDKLDLDVSGSEWRAALTAFLDAEISSMRAAVDPRGATSLADWGLAE
jgi:hypothetical protein